MANKGVSISTLPTKGLYPIIISKRRWRLKNVSPHNPAHRPPFGLQKSSQSPIPFNWKNDQNGSSINNNSNGEERAIDLLTPDELRSELRSARQQILQLKLALVANTSHYQYNQSNGSSAPPTPTTSNGNNTPTGSVNDSKETMSSDASPTTPTVAQTIAQIDVLPSSSLDNSNNGVIEEALIDDFGDDASLQDNRTPLTRQASAPATMMHTPSAPLSPPPPPAAPLSSSSSSPPPSVLSPATMSPSLVLPATNTSASSSSSSSIAVSSLPPSFRSGALNEMFTVLSSLPWRRIDVIGN
jgi:hypothetical protein